MILNTIELIFAAVFQSRCVLYSPQFLEVSQFLWGKLTFISISRLLKTPELFSRLSNFRAIGHYCGFRLVFSPQILRPITLKYPVSPSFCISRLFFIKYSDSWCHFICCRHFSLFLRFYRRGAVTSWLLRSTPGRVAWVRALAGVIVLCS